MGLHDEAGTIVAALGLRRADEHRLFLEQYFERPIEHIVSQATGATIDRGEIIELGNLAARDRRATMRLIIATAAHLTTLEYRYTVLTATKQLRDTFDAFGLAWTALGPANAQRLADGGRSWGRYYRNDPQVIVGEIAPAIARLRERFSKMGASE